LANYSVELSDKDQKNADFIENLINNFNFEPLRVKLLAEESNLPNKKLLELLHVLKGQNKVVEIPDGMWSSRLKIEEIIADLKQYFAKSDDLSVVQFKDITGLTRKSAIPLLEYFDNQKITSRDGNNRQKGEKL